MIVALAAALVLGLAPGPMPAHAASHAVSPPSLDEIDQAAAAAVASGEVPGAVVLVGRGTEILYHRAHGHRRVVPSPAPMTTDTIFDVASLTKPLATTLAVMALVERGTLALEAPLGRYLPEFRGPTFAGVTLARLLTHTAGFPAHAQTADVKPGFPAAAARLARHPLAYTPGTGFIYSDFGFMLLGEVVRRVAREPLDAFLARTMFRPLGLKDTAFNPPPRWQPRIAPTAFLDGRLLHGTVHDPRARALGGVAGHAGLFSTSADLARLVQALLAGGELGSVRILRAETVSHLWDTRTDPEGRRVLGWDLASQFSRTMGPFFPQGGVGHTGFTGTALWLDPASRTYMILLTNRVHPNGHGSQGIRELRRRVAGIVGAALFDPGPLAPVAISSATSQAVSSATSRAAPPVSSPAAPAGQPPASALAGAPAPTPAGSPASPADLTVGRAHGGARAPVSSGLDVLAARGFTPLRGKTVGLVTNHTGVDRHGRRGIDLLARAPGVRLEAIFSPEHGLGGEVDADVAHGRDVATGRPVWSLYGPTRRPSAEMLRGLTALVFDVQDVGVRYYTYLTTLLYVMEEGARHGIPVIVLDRPNPITGRVVEGPLMDADLRSFTGPHALPVRTGLTIGEYARLVAAERQVAVDLTVVPLEGWDRARWYDETGLPWRNPSPNIRTLNQALLYAGIGVLEATNLSVGRGTPTPFEVVGAPWIDGPALTAALARYRLEGVRIEPTSFTPQADRYSGQACGGIRVVVTDRDRARPLAVGLAVATELRALYRDRFRAENIQNLLVNRSTMWGFLRGEPLDGLLARAAADHVAYRARRASYLMYP